MKVLSLFDGMSCTQIALKNLGIKVDTYYASEIDKYGIQIAKKNFPDTVHLGDVKDIKGKDLPEIDLIVAGSPCQGFSFAGKQLAFDDPRSALFFEFVRILKEVKPKYFLLENVRMKKEFQAVISEQISSIYPECTNGGLFGIEPILINSALLSAQNRNRLYWTNIPNIEQPEDVGLVLRDVLEDFPTKEFYAGKELQKNYAGGNQLNPDYKSQCNTIHDIDKKSPTISAGTHGYANGYISEKANDELKKMTTKDGKAYALTATYQGAVAWNSIERKQRTMVPTYNTPKQVGTAADLKGYDIIKRIYSEDGKSPTLTTMGGGHREPKVAVKGGAIRGRAYDDKGKRLDKNGKSVASKTKQMLEVRKDYKSNAITTVQKDSIAVKEEELTWRKLTPLECERLQTVPDNYTDGVSNTQRYKMLGNGFTVRVIEHILKNMNEKGE